MLLAELVDTSAAVSATRARREKIGLLAELLTALSGALALVSGRAVSDLDRLFAPLELPAAGLHGLEHRDAAGRLSTLGEAAALDHLRVPLRAFADTHAGLLLEDKGRALALHYRGAPNLGPEALARIEALAASEPDLRLIHGKMVIEVKPKHADKGSAIRAFMSEPPFRGRVPVFLGDDVTDAAGFAAVNELQGLSIHVGESPETAAAFRLADVDQVRDWLADAAERLAVRPSGGCA